MIARFLHFFPQYTLADLGPAGRLSLGEFRLLYAGMIDLENPEAAEPREETVARKVREAHLRSRKGWG